MKGLINMASSAMAILDEPFVVNVKEPAPKDLVPVSGFTGTPSKF
jgi:hypothetical protein